VGWDPVNKSADAIISSSGDANAVANDQLTESGPFTGNWVNAVSSFTLSGKVYFEYVSFNNGSATVDSPIVGVVNESWDENQQTTPVGRDSGPANSAGLNPTTAAPQVRSYQANVFTDLTGTLGTTPVHGDVWQIAFDTATGKLWFGRNNTFVGDPGAGTGETYTVTGTTFRLGANLFDSIGIGIKGRFNSSAQSFSPPTGFSAPEANPATLLTPSALTQAHTVAQPGILSFPILLAANNMAQAHTVAQPGIGPEFTVAPSALAQVHTFAQPSVTFDALLTPVALTQAQTIGAPTITMSVLLWAGDAGLAPVETGPSTLVPGAGFAGNAELPPLEWDIHFGWQGAGDLTAFESEGVLLAGLLFSGDVTLPAIRSTSAAAFDGTWSASIQLPSMQGSGTLLTGWSFVGDGALQMFTGAGTMFRRGVYAADFALPALDTPGGVFLSGALFGGDGTLVPLTGAAEMEDGSTLLFFGLSTNTFNLHHGGYLEVPYVGMARLGRSTYAALSDGLYRLDGGDDAGVPIQARFMLGFTDLGVEAVKSQRVAYLGGKFDGRLAVIVRTDQSQSELRYVAEMPYDQAAGKAPARVKIGRGLRGRYWQLGIENVDGNSFELDRIGMGTWSSRRKR